MAWIYLILAGIFEVVWAFALKESKGFTQLWPSVIMIVGMIISFGLLSLALKNIPLGTGYAIWTGIGALGTVIVGIIFLNEGASLLKIVFAALLIISLVGLKFTTHG